MADLKALQEIDEKSKLTSDGDTAKIKFQQSTNGEAKVEMPDAGAVGFQCGLTKEELMKYANDPFWIVLRRVLLVLFWLLWIAMLAGAVAIIIVTPGCAAPKEPEWFESSPAYEIRVDKYFDGDGDGKPDFEGVYKKLPHLKEISVSTVVLDKLFNPAKQRVMEPSVGNFDIFSNLTKHVKVVVKIPLSQVPLQTETEKQDFATTLVFWLEKGSAGFVFDELELVANKVQNIEKLLKDWSGIIANASTKEFPRVMMLSSYGNELNETLHCSNTTFILDFGLMELKTNFDASQFMERFEPTLQKNRTTCRSNLVFSNSDIAPLLSRYSGEERDRIIMFSLLADATPFVFFGEEYARADREMPLTLQRQNNKQPAEMNWKVIEGFSKQKDNNFYEVFRKTSEIRSKNSAIQSGETHLKTINGTVVAMSRIMRKNPGYVVVTNFDTEPKTVNLKELGEHMPDVGDLSVVSSRAGEIAKGKRSMSFGEFAIGGQETMILSFIANFK